MVIDTPICPNDAADMVSTTSANSNERTDGIFIKGSPL
jgi:hypothetical protein